jgi:hypothetical protein
LNVELADVIPSAGVTMYPPTVEDRGMPLASG